MHIKGARQMVGVSGAARSHSRSPYYHLEFFLRPGRTPSAGLHAEMSYTGHITYLHEP
jgi:shikimate 5-dehydrogenase